MFHSDSDPRLPGPIPHHSTKFRGNPLTCFRVTSLTNQQTDMDRGNDPLFLLFLWQTSPTAPPSAPRMRLREATQLCGSALLPHLPHLWGRRQPTLPPTSQHRDPDPGRLAKAPPLPPPWWEPRREAPNRCTWDANIRYWTRHPHSSSNGFASLRLLNAELKCNR